MSITEIKPDIEGYLHSPSSIIVFGNPNAGKTTSIASIPGIERCLWIVSSRKELRGFASLLKMKMQEAAALKAAGQPIPPSLDRFIKKKLPEKVIEISEFKKLEDGTTVRISNEQVIRSVIDAYLRKLQVEPDAYAGLVLASWSILAKRIHDDMGLRLGKNGWDVGKEIHALHRWLMREVPQVSGKSLILDCHKREPDFDKGGAMTNFAGPLLPTGPLGKPVAGEADFIFELKKEVIEVGSKEDGTLREEERRVWYCDPDETTMRKRRDARINSIECGTLEEVLAKGDVVIQ